MRGTRLRGVLFILVFEDISFSPTFNVIIIIRNPSYDSQQNYNTFILSIHKNGGP